MHSSEALRQGLPGFQFPSCFPLSRRIPFVFIDNKKSPILRKNQFRNTGLVVICYYFNTGPINQIDAPVIDLDSIWSSVKSWRMNLWTVDFVLSELVNVHKIGLNTFCIFFCLKNGKRAEIKRKSSQFLPWYGRFGRSDPWSPRSGSLKTQWKKRPEKRRRGCCIKSRKKTTG